jgi:hypothetical protein
MADEIEEEPIVTDEPEVTTEEEVAVLDMSDEAFLESEYADESTEESTVEEIEPEGEMEGETDPEIESEGEVADGEPAIEKDEEEEEVTDPELDPKEEKEEPEPKDSAEVNYEDIGKQIMAEFKANGRSMKPKSAEDAINLMQMGANYHKKMAGLKPSLKVLKLLERKDLLDPEKINYLIDLHDKNPKAITKLLQDSKLDPMDINVTDESDYKPSNQTVSDKELTLDDVLEGIQDTPTYNKTLNVLTSEWDSASRKEIANDPHIITVINEHMDNGIYDQVVEVMDYERSMGRLAGLSNLEAYNQTGAAMSEANQFKHQVEAPEQAPVKAAPVKPVKKTTAQLNKDAERLLKKKAASPTKHSPATKVEKNYNPLLMSDEDFLKEFEKMG